MARTAVILLIAGVFVIVLFGCSSDITEQTTPEMVDNALIIPSSDLESTNHSLIGLWNVEFDVENLSVDVHSARETSLHYNITTMLPSPGIVFNSYNPSTGIADVDVTINNPFSFGAYDLRLIIYSDAAGHELRNSDEWTDMWDIPGGNVINGFKAYAKLEPDRYFAGLTHHTENLRIYMPGGNFLVQFAIDASYPSNCIEPYMINNWSHGNLTSQGGTQVFMSVDVYDWQSDVTAVLLYCPVVTGSTLVPFNFDSGNSWSSILRNGTGIGEGQYPGVIVANSGGLALYDYVVITVSPPPPPYDWAVTVGGVESEVAKSCVTGIGSDVYVAGTFQDAVDFDPGSGINSLMSQGKADSYLAKYNNTGDLVWVTGWGGFDDCFAFELVIDSAQNLYVLGHFKGTVDFDPGTGVYNETAMGSNFDVYLTQFSSHGTWQWAKVWGGELYDQAMCLAASGSNEVYAVSEFYETVDFKPGPDTFNLTSKGQRDFAVVKFDYTGGWIWASSVGGVDNDFCNDIVISSTGDILMNGGFWATVDFDPNSGVAERTPVGRDDAFICQWDSSANFIWVTSIGGTMNENSHAITVDNTNSIYVSGTFGGPVDFDPGLDVEEYSPSGWSDIFVTKYDNMHRYKWTGVFGGPSVETPEAMSVDSNNNILVSGSYEESVDFDPGSGQEVYVSNGVRDAYVSMFSPTGVHKWAMVWGGSNHEFALDVDAKYGNTIYVCGYFDESVDFDPGSGVDLRETYGSNDLFISKFN